MSNFNADNINVGAKLKFAGYTTANLPTGLGSGDAGTAVYNLDEDRLNVWNGTEWTTLAGTRTSTLDGTSADKANGSALLIMLDVYAAGGTLQDVQALEGPLWINPQKFAGTNATANPFQVWCDMTTQGGGWTLGIKYDRDQATSSKYSLERNGGTNYYGHTGLSTLDPRGALYETLDMRDIINANKARGTAYGRWLMHCCTEGSVNVTRAMYTGHAFNSTAYAAASVSAGGTTTLNTSPTFSQLHNNIYADPTELWNTQGSSITNSGGGSTSTVQNYQSSTDIATYGGGVFYALGTDYSLPSTANIQTNSSLITSSTDDTGNVTRQDTLDGNYMFSCTSREGSVYCSGTNSTSTQSGHNSPAFNWGWFSKDGTQQSYGYGSLSTIGTHCASSFSSTNTPGKKMNYMFIR